MCASLAWRKVVEGKRRIEAGLMFMWTMGLDLVEKEEGHKPRQLGEKNEAPNWCPGRGPLQAKRNEERVNLVAKKQHHQSTVLVPFAG